ncbi:hypothetical protein SAMN06296952_2214 [Oscillospiraceae bacterium]|nr:hypothetical protein SAMN06296952_2214 [Oscillospiraceae bacterium]
MKTKNNLRKILAIVISLFLGNGLLLSLGLLFPKALAAILPADPFVKSFIVELIGALISIGLIFFFHKTHVLKITSSGMKEGLGCGLPMLILYGLFLLLGISNLAGQTLIPTWQITLFALRCILIGVAEEGLFRGVIQELFMDIFGKDTRKGVMLSIFCAATVFGLNHFQNLIAGVTLPAVLIQVLSAVAAGLMFGAIVFRSGRIIWPMVIVHALVDGSSFIYSGILTGASSDVDSVNSLNPVNLVMVLVFAGIFFFLMRREKTAELYEGK